MMMTRGKKEVQKVECNTVQGTKLASIASASGSKELNYEIVNIRKCCGSKLILFNGAYVRVILRQYVILSQALKENVAFHFKYQGTCSILTIH